VPVGKYRISGSEIFVPLAAAGRCSVSIKLWMRNESQKSLLKVDSVLYRRCVTFVSDSFYKLLNYT
jgi:hypothetical protein